MKRILLSGAALAALVAAPLLSGAPAIAQNSADSKKPTTSVVTSDPLSIKTSAEVKDEKANAEVKPQNTSAPATQGNAAPATPQTAQPAAAATDKPAAQAATPATPAAPQTASTTSNASVRLGTDVEGRVSINAAQARDMSTALRSGGAHPIEGVDITIKAGTVVPAAVHLTVVSPAIVEVFPQFRGYSYFTTREEVVIVEPASKKIVALVPLKETVTASKPSNAKTARASNGERVVTRRAERERVTTGVSLRDDGGDLPPPGMVLRETTVTTANGTRTYRRLEPAGNAVVIRRRARTFDFDTDY